MIGKIFFTLSLPFVALACLKAQLVELQNASISDTLVSYEWTAQNGAQSIIQSSDNLTNWLDERGLWTGGPLATSFHASFDHTPFQSKFYRIKGIPAAAPDSDFDRLSDAEEATLGTDPFCADSNGNGYGDWEESLLSAPPASPQANPLSVSLTQLSANSPPVTAYRDDRVITLDLDFIAGNPWHTFDQQADGLGSVGFHISWHPVDDPSRTASTITSYRRVDLQAVWNEVPYQITVTPVNRLGQLLTGQKTEGIIHGGSDLRVKTLRSEMTFFDDFNQSQGLPSELKWNSTFATPNNPDFNGLFVNHQYHVHTSCGTRNGGSGDRAQTVHRPRKPLVLESGETRRIVFDLDGIEGRARGIWYLDIVPSLIDITGHSGIGVGDTEGMAFPAYGLRFKLAGQGLALLAFNEEGQQIEIATADNLHWDGLELHANVRRHWEIRLSPDSASVLIDGQEVLNSPLGAHSLTPGEYHLHWNVFAYNSWKRNFPFYVVHWDNFGFDGPDPLADIEVHNYRTTVMGTDYRESANHQPTDFQIEIPGSLLTTSPGAQAEASLCFTLQRDDFTAYVHHPNDAISVNGTSYPIPAPQTNGLTPLTPGELVSAIVPHSMRIPLGSISDTSSAPLLTGTNILTFTTLSSGIHNVHLEIDYPSNSAPPFTESRSLHPVLIHPHFPKPGLPVTIESIGSHPVGNWRQHLEEKATFNPTVSGTIPILVAANAAIFNNTPTKLYPNFVSSNAAAFGVNPGLQYLELKVRPDDASDPVHTQRLDLNVDVPAPQCAHAFQLDTTTLPNGIYEVEVTGKDGRGNALSPDYYGVGQATGTVSQMNGYYFPLHVTVAN